MARESGPFEYFDERTGSSGVTANTIRANLTDPTRNNDAIIALATTLDADGRAAANQVDGDIDQAVRSLPDDAKATASNLGANGAYALGLMRRLAEAVETFDNTTNTCNVRYRTDLASAMRWAGQAAAYTEDPEDDKQVTEAHMGPGIESNIRTSTYNPAWNTLDTEIDALVTDFDNGPSPEAVRKLIRDGLLPLSAAGLYPGLTLTEEDKAKYYENVLGQMSPEEQKQWIEDNLENLDPAVANVVAPEVMEHFADEVANDIKDPETIDSRTVALLNFFKEEETFANQLYNTVTPTEMGDAVVHLSQQLNGDITVQSGTEDPEKLLSLYNGFMNGAGVALATHSRSDSTDSTQLAEDWFNAITNDDNKAHAAALTMLLREGGEQPAGEYDATFIDKLASDVLEWERDQDGAVWGPRATESGVYILDPDKVELMNVRDEGGYYTWTTAGGQFTDGMANLLGAMGNSPEGAQRFFMESDGSVDEDRLEYLVTDRTFSAIDGSDEGDGLGEALQAATVGGTDGENGDWNRNEGATLASSTFQLIADHSGTGDGFGPDDKWHMWPEMADNMGLIASGFSSDVYDIIDGSPQSTTDDPKPGHLTISSTDFDKVLGEIGRGDKTGIESLSASIMIEGNNRFNDRIEEWQEAHPGQPLTMESLAGSGLAEALGGRGETNGQILGHILNKSVLVDLDDKEIAATRAAYISKAIDIAGGFIPGAGSVLGEGASEIAKSAFDTAKGEGIALLQGAVEGSPSTGDPEYRQASRGSTETALEYNLINQLVRNGYMGEQSPGDSSPDPGIPESLLVDGPGNTRIINPHLYNYDGVDTIGEDGQYTAAELRQLRADWHEWRNSTPFDIANGVVTQGSEGFDREVNKGP